jgi:RNA polymerase-binding transcription factor DksA
MDSPEFESPEFDSAMADGPDFDGLVADDPVFESAVGESAPGFGEDVDLGLLDGIEAQIADVEYALDRLDKGTYGTCEECDEPIADAELSERPEARSCAEHAPAA